MDVAVTFREVFIKFYVKHVREKLLQPRDVMQAGFMNRIRVTSGGEFA